MTAASSLLLLFAVTRVAILLQEFVAEEPVAVGNLTLLQRMRGTDLRSSVTAASCRAAIGMGIMPGCSERRLAQQP